MVRVVKDLLSLLADVENGFHHCHRVAPPQCLSSQEDAVHAIQHSIGNVSRLSPTDMQALVRCGSYTNLETECCLTVQHSNGNVQCNSPADIQLSARCSPCSITSHAGLVHHIAGLQQQHLCNLLQVQRRPQARCLDG